MGDNLTVGSSGYPDASGRVSLDAAIMLEPSRHGAVACVRSTQNPILLARIVMEMTKHRLLVGPDADALARKHELKLAGPLSPRAKEAWEKWKKDKDGFSLANLEDVYEGNHDTNHDTIGVIALDSHGQLACATSTDCPAGYFCATRRCDGARACYPNGDPLASCDRVGTERCPAVAAYNVCTGDSECGPYATCTAYGDGRRICSRRCSADQDCPSPPPGSSGVVQRCDSRSQRCFLDCTGPGTCPFGLSCFRYDTGTYGYCS